MGGSSVLGHVHRWNGDAGQWSLSTDRGSGAIDQK